MDISKCRVDGYKKIQGAKLSKINNQVLKGKRVKVEKKTKRNYFQYRIKIDKKLATFPYS